MLEHEYFAGSFELSPREIRVTMPSNIALIKYMGRSDHHLKLPLNPSLSVTLSNLKSLIICRSLDSRNLVNDYLDPIQDSGFFLDVDAKGRQRFLEFWSFLKSQFQIKGTYYLKSGNNFPSDCGIASSSSSFAALTVTAYLCAKYFENSPVNLSLEQLAALSRRGSGASVRSFMRGVVIWDGETIRRAEVKNLMGGSHLVIVVSGQKKKVTSSQAHQRVASSLLLFDRARRAQQRLERILDPQIAWKELFTVVWNEFWDMMALFETSQPPFGYFCGNAMDVLNFIRDLWEKNNDGPLVTMDAGPNIHLLFRKDQATKRDELLNKIGEKWQLTTYFSEI